MAVVKKYFLSTLWTQDGKVTNCGSNENLENGINFNQYAPLDLSGGHDSVTVTGNSTLYGDIDAGSGDDVITISSGSSVHGSLIGDAELCLILSGAAATNWNRSSKAAAAKPLPAGIFLTPAFKMAEEVGP